MFTGIIEEVGKISDINQKSGYRKLLVRADKVLNDLKIDDSIAINGTCQTVTRISDDRFEVEAVGETLQKTTLGLLKRGDFVNLERALMLSSRLGGHLVQGHVNGIGKVSNFQKRGNAWLLQIKVPSELTDFIVSEGSIAIDGISFTVAQMQENQISINLIPHTYESTNIKNLKPSAPVNIEVDILSKYVKNFMQKKNKENSTVNGWLDKKGW